MSRPNCARSWPVPLMIDPEFDSAADYAPFMVDALPRASDRLPLRHPYFQTARDEQAAAFREEVRRSIARDDAFRARLASARVLESVQ